MFEENILENNFGDDLLEDNSVFENNSSEFYNGEDEDGVDFESFDDATPDW